MRYPVEEISLNKIPTSCPMCEAGENTRILARVEYFIAPFTKNSGLSRYKSGVGSMHMTHKESILYIATLV